MSKTLNIYLSGFMGCGKSTVAKFLAHKLRWHFVDTDTLINAQTQLTIPEIFAKLGEKHFRDLEHLVLTQIAAQKKQVVALGGGMVMRADNRVILRQGHWIFLNTPWAILSKRIHGDPTRPLTQNGLGSLQQLWQNRLPYYQEAPLHWQCEQQTADAIATQLARHFKDLKIK